MELRICPGIEKLYRLALVEGDDFTVLSEHDCEAEAINARTRARMAAEQATRDLERIAA
ncbi:hypothetical protein D3C72_1997030 [compost metagenome]